MKLYEFEGKSLFKKIGIPIPRGYVAASMTEARTAARRIGFPVVVKSQILGGGRGKAGGILFAESASVLSEKAKHLLHLNIAGETVEKLLIEEKISGAQEFYMGITLDPLVSIPMVMVSAKGGVDVESVLSESPRTVFKTHLNPLKTAYPHHMIELVSKTGLTGRLLTRTSDILLKLVQCYFKYESITAEINPLIIGVDETAVAADSKVEIDDSAFFRLPEAREFIRDDTSRDPLEAEAKAIGVSYVRMDGGDIGLISGGAGLGMATMDMISAHGGVPANFLDLGGNATPEKTAAAIAIVLKTPGVKGVLLNVFGGVNNCEEMAEGIAQVIDTLKPPQAITVKMRGHSQEDGWALLAQRNIPIVKYGTTEEAVVLLMEEMKKKGAA